MKIYETRGQGDKPHETNNKKHSKEESAQAMKINYSIV